MKIKGRGEIRTCLSFLKAKGWTVSEEENHKSPCVDTTETFGASTPQQSSSFINEPVFQIEESKARTAGKAKGTDK